MYNALKVYGCKIVDSLLPNGTILADSGEYIGAIEGCVGGGRYCAVDTGHVYLSLRHHTLAHVPTLAPVLSLKAQGLAKLSPDMTILGSNFGGEAEVGEGLI